MKNELQSPKVLACPSDTNKRQATTFDQNPMSGLAHQSFRNNAVSYWIGLDAIVLGGGASGKGFEFSPSPALAGDRNLTPSGNSGCSSGVLGAELISASVNPAIRTANTQWTAEIHKNTGNMLLVDGSVLQLSNRGLQRSMTEAEDNGSVHILKP